MKRLVSTTGKESIPNTNTTKQVESTNNKTANNKVINYFCTKHKKYLISINCCINCEHLYKKAIIPQLKHIQ